MKYSQFAVIMLVMRCVYIYMKVITGRYMNIFIYSLCVTLEWPWNKCVLNNNNNNNNNNNDDDNDDDDDDDDDDNNKWSH